MTASWIPLPQSRSWVAQAFWCLSVLRQHKQATAREIADETGIYIDTVRRYLTTAETQGLAKVTLARTRGCKGKAAVWEAV